MIHEHEIPSGSKIYFGQLAKKKRDLENKASEFLESCGFEQIVTPNFSYQTHQSIDDTTKLIKINDGENNSITLRADSTLDVVRLITKRLGRTTMHKKWFYIQPIFLYPTTEIYQIGAEWINHTNISDILNLNCDLLDKLDISYFVQISNINIPLIISKHYNIDIDIFKNGQIDKLFDLNMSWLVDMIYIQDVKQLQEKLDTIPTILQDECQKLINIANQTKHKVSISLLYYNGMKYYNDIFYQVIANNLTIAQGGGYKSNEVDSLGFALYTDNLLKLKQQDKNE
jgi:histidyl-tRNA synthetase